MTWYPPERVPHPPNPPNSHAGRTSDGVPQTPRRGGSAPVGRGGILPIAMSDPAPPLRPARWLDRASMLLVGASLAVATAAATPSLLRAGGLVLRPPPEVAAPPPHAVRPQVPPPRGPISASDDHPQFFPNDDPPRLTDLERELLRGAEPGRDPNAEIFAPPPAGRRASPAPRSPCASGPTSTPRSPAGCPRARP